MSKIDYVIEVKMHKMIILGRGLYTPLYVLFLTVFITVTFFSPAFGITVKEEEELSKEFIRIMSRGFNFVDDPYIHDYVNDVGKKLLKNMPPQPYEFEFYVVENKVYNAFALPGGKIFIYTGLIEAMDSESELAGILAHEISHVICRHYSKNMEKAPLISAASLAGLAAGVLLGAGGAGEAAQAVTMGTIAASQSLQLSYSRDNEMQADQIGLTYLVKTGYDGEGLLKILKEIRTKDWYDENQIPSYLRTHPAINDRIATIDTWLESRNNEEKETAKNNVEKNRKAFDMAKMRLLALYGDKDDVLNRFTAIVEKNPKDPLANDALGLVKERMGNRKEAISHFQAAVKEKALDPYFLIDLGKSYFLDGKYNDAKDALEGGLSLVQEDFQGNFYLARTMLKLENPTEAERIFDGLLADLKDYKTVYPMEQVYFFIGETKNALGKTGDAHFYLGHYYKIKRDLKTAMFHLKKALEETTDKEKKDEINALLKEITKDKNESESASTRKQ